MQATEILYMHVGIRSHVTDKTTDNFFFHSSLFWLTDGFYGWFRNGIWIWVYGNFWISIIFLCLRLLHLWLCLLTTVDNSTFTCSKNLAITFQWVHIGTSRDRKWCSLSRQPNSIFDTFSIGKWENILFSGMMHVHHVEYTYMDVV